VRAALAGTQHADVQHAALNGEGNLDSAADAAQLAMFAVLDPIDTPEAQRRLLHAQIPGNWRLRWTQDAQETFDGMEEQLEAARAHTRLPDDDTFSNAELQLFENVAWQLRHIQAETSTMLDILGPFLEHNTTDRFRQLECEQQRNFMCASV
jgi:hypothetical protein